tara:strand:- start:59 stop:1471 length:1413 start_codon:yes stop_codon:yes gene_type:complete
MGLQQYTEREYYEEGLGLGRYQFTTLHQIISNFQVMYVGENKIISKVKRVDIDFHAQRALAELSYDTLNSRRAQEFVVPNSLAMKLPSDYVNYTKLSWVDSSGIKHIIYPENKSSNPPMHAYQNADGNFELSMLVTLTDGSNVFVMDGDYSAQVVTGMKFNAHPYIEVASYVHEVSTVGGITSVTVRNQKGHKDMPAKDILSTTGSSTAVIELRLQGGNKIGIGRANTNRHFGTTVTTNATKGDKVIIVDDTSGLKRGMFVVHPAFPNSSSGTGTAAKVISFGPNHVEFDRELGSGGKDTAPAGTYDATAGDTIGFLEVNSPDATTWENYKSNKPSENQDDYIDNTYYPLAGNRYGLEPERAQANGYFFIDQGMIHFSSNLAGKTIVVDYISDNLEYDGSMSVHKFAEEAMYKSIVYGILSTRANVQEYIVRRYKKERFAAIRAAKLRLSNIKLEEITQILRGKSKQIKH